MTIRQPARVVILGGSFAGLFTALELEKRMPADGSLQVTLISHDNYLLFTPMLAEVAAGEVSPDNVAVPLRRFLRRVRVWQGDATGADLQRKVVLMRHLVTGEPAEVPYDHLVLALGSVTSYHHVPGAPENSLTFKSLEDAANARAHLIDALEQASVQTDAGARRALLTIVVTGGGNTGVELAASLNDLAESMRRCYPGLARERARVVLVHHGQRLLEQLDDSLAAYALRLLRRRRVDVRLSTDVKEVRADGVELDPGGTLPTRMVFWTAGIAPSPFVDALPVPKDHHGAVIVDGNFAVQGNPGVWALGDCASIPNPKGGTYAPLAQNAEREGPAVAANILATLRGQPLKSFTFQPLGMMTPLGSHRAVARIFGRNLSGLPAWLLWRAAYLSKLPGLDRKIRVGTDWLLDTILPPDIVDTLGRTPSPPVPAVAPAGAAAATSKASHPSPADAVTTPASAPASKK